MIEQASMAAVIRAEQGVLGRLMSSQQAAHQVMDVLRGEYFAEPGHKAIWEAIVRRAEAGEGIDSIMICADLQAVGLLEHAGGGEYVRSLIAADPGAPLLRTYADLVRESWVARRVTELSDEAKMTAAGASAEAGAPPGRQAVEQLEAGLLALAEHLEDETPAVPLGQAVGEAIRKGQEAAARGTVFVGVSSGYAAIDRMLCGLSPGDVILLGARPSMGKTALGAGIAVRASARLRSDMQRAQHDPSTFAAPEHTRVLLWSGEMAADQLGARVAAAHANLSVASVFTFRQMGLPDDRQDRRVPPPLTQAQIDRLVGAQDEAGHLGVVIDDRAGITVARLRHRARRMRRQVKLGGLAMVVVDYVGLMRASAEATRQGKVQEMTEISRGLKDLARELGVPVLALAQLNRGVEGREDKTPQMHDLRESGALEQDADKIMFLHRPHYYLSRALPTQTPKETGEAFAQRMESWQAAVRASEGRAIISIAKNRQGPTGVTELKFCDHAVWFRDEAERDDAPAWPSYMTAARRQDY